MDITIYHNPACGTSRNTLKLLEHLGYVPSVVEYLKAPPSRETIKTLVARMGVPLRDVIREKGTPFAELGLGSADVSDEVLLDAIAMHPVLLNRPIVVTPKGVRLCRPSEVVLELLDGPFHGPFVKEDGELILDAEGQPVGLLSS